MLVYNTGKQTSDTMFATNRIQVPEGEMSAARVSPDVTFRAHVRSRGATAISGFTIRCASRADSMCSNATTGERSLDKSVRDLGPQRADFSVDSATRARILIEDGKRATVHMDWHNTNEWNECASIDLSEARSERSFFGRVHIAAHN